MRRVTAISLAILVVMTTTGAVMAQDAGQSVSDRLLEILKERQIISGDEYGELKGLATEMQAERVELNTRLGDLDRSITEYLAKDDEALGSNVTYQVGNGFTFATQDGRFALTIGGMFKFGFQSVNRDRNPFGCDDCPDPLPTGFKVPTQDYLTRRDVNNFGMDNRFHFQGHAFDPDLTFYFEFTTDEYVSLFEGWVNYNLNDWFNVKAGKQRVPTGRQALIHQSDLSFGNRAWESINAYGVNAGWGIPALDTGTMYGVTQDLGISIHNRYDDMVDTMGDEGLAVEYQFGLYNGALSANNNWVAPAFRLAVHPFGYVPYTEGDWTSDANPKFAIGVNYGSDKGVPANDGFGNKTTTFYSWDGVVTWSGLYLTAEYHVNSYKDDTVSRQKQRSWFVQGGFMVMPKELELMLRYATQGTESPWQTAEMSAGAAYYFEGHHLKGIIEIGQQNTEAASGSSLDDAKVGFLRLTFQLEW